MKLIYTNNRLSMIFFLTLLFSMGSAKVGWGQEVLIYSTGFEDSEGFTAGTTYNNTTIKYDGPVSQQWGTFYGTASTTDAISGFQSMQMRWYTSAPANLGYTFTDFDLANVTKVDFFASSTNGINVIVSYSTNGGDTFSGDETFVLTTTSTKYTYNISATGEHPNVRIMFTIAYTTAPTAISRLYIDDVDVYGIPDEAILLVSPTTLTGFSYTEGSGPSDPQSFQISGTNLDGSNVTISAPANFQISDSESGSYSSSITLPFYDGTETNIWARLLEDLEPGEYSGNVQIAGGGAGQVNVGVTGMVNMIYDYVEQFNNYPQSGTTYGSGSFAGVAGNTWNYVNANEAGTIDVKTVMLRNTNDASLNSTIAGGIKEFSFDYMQAFSTNVNLGVYINDVLITTVTTNNEQGIVKNSGNIVVTDVVGSFKVEFKRIGSGGQVAIDNFSWNMAEVITTTLSGTSDWGAGSWTADIPDQSANAIIDGTVTISSATSAETNGLTINAGRSLLIEGSLTVNGTLTNNAGATGLVLEPGAKLLHNTTGVDATVKQTVAGGGTWNKNDKSGTVWYWISPPVSGQNINSLVGSLTNYDLYRWDEPADTWRNFKDVSFGQTDFERSTGYLFGSQDVVNLDYQGTLFAGDISWSSLSRQGTGAAPEYSPGWHLLGNPYSTGLQYLETGDGEWSGTNVARTPQYWTGSSYQAYAVNGVIPVGTAFFVEATADNGSLTVPAAAREGVGPVKKSGEDLRIEMIARPAEGTSWQSSHVRLVPDVAEGFDNRYHASFRPGIAPQFYSVMDDNRLLVHAVREVRNDLIIPFAFIKNNEGHDFHIELSQTIPSATLFLADLKTGTIHELTPDSPYAFNAEEDDDPMRFELRFQQAGEPTSTRPPAQEHMARIYTSGNTLYINFHEAIHGNRLEVYDTSGRLLIQQQLGPGTNHQQPLNLQSGVYLVRLTGPQHIQTERVFVP